ncbi:DNA-binding NarL/FixJ family response regulator [Pseudoclavibacter chungangensis]|uniref:response regulator n=1 Tax=Pseudoclavibacter chungangensis TaxID=587635 RepID=UPI0017A69C28|nr:response regulator transcription factor [Pseudoclavibacter chungangensis]NYJ66942.1 DNA-binding NarL/FixJ family response regulator [Pseudoclavibacter chungangensis]
MTGAERAGDVRVLVVDDQTLVRRGLVGLVGLMPGVAVVGEAVDGADGLARVDELAPDVVLLDLRMPGTDGQWLLERLARRGVPGPAVLVLTTFDDDERLLAAVRAGARGYLLKDVSLETLLEAIEALAAGEGYLHPAVTDRLLASVRASAAAGGDGASADGITVAPLTRRELEILRLVAAGLTNRDIAEALVLAEGTVKNHVSAVLLKLGTTDRTNAVLRALREGVLD